MARRKSSELSKTRNCKKCWKEFTRRETKKFQKYCSRACSNSVWPARKKIKNKKELETEKNRKEHWNSTRDSDKRKKLLDLIKKDVPQEKACNYVWLAVSTIHDWIKRDKELSEEYDQAKGYMDVISSNALASAMLDSKASKSERAKRAMERKKRRDNRYKDKNEITGPDDKPLLPSVINIIWTWTDEGK